MDNRELYIAASNPTGRNPDNIDLYVTEYEILDQDDNGDFFYIWGATHARGSAEYARRLGGTTSPECGRQ